MPIPVTCVCGMSYPVKEEFAGMQVQCPACGQVLNIPRQGSARAAKPMPIRPASPPPAAPPIPTVVASWSDDSAGAAPKGGSLAGVAVAVFLLLLLCVGGTLVVLVQMQ